MSSLLTEKEQDIFDEYAMGNSSINKIRLDFGISEEYLISIIARGNKDIENCTCSGFFTDTNLCYIHGN